MEAHTAQFEWVLQKRVAEITGMTVVAMDQLRNKGILREEVLWHKKNGRIWINTKRFNEWSQQELMGLIDAGVDLLLSSP
jgi:hypothetical protein